jgi:hypothetical protein
MRLAARTRSRDMSTSPPGRKSTLWRGLPYIRVDELSITKNLGSKKGGVYRAVTRPPMRVDASQARKRFPRLEERTYPLRSGVSGIRSGAIQPVAA